MNARAVAAPTLATDLLSLTKPRLSALVLMTTLGGMALAPGSVPLSVWLLTLVGTAGLVGAANAFNCYLERDTDRWMARTLHRPLPSGRLEPAVALGFAVALVVLAVPTLQLGVNGLTTALGLLALVSYVMVYTPLKARSPLALWFGAVPGALPPLMGWTAATGRVGAGGLALFAILFLWQLPHFLAIALFRKEEYRRAGLTSVPLAMGDPSTRVQIVLYLSVLVPVTLLPFWFGVASALYAGVAFALGLAFWGFGLYGYWTRGGTRWARRLFAMSLVHLSGLMLALLTDMALGTTP